MVIYWVPSAIRHTHTHTVLFKYSNNKSQTNETVCDCKNILLKFFFGCCKTQIKGLQYLTKKESLVQANHYCTLKSRQSQAIKHKTQNNWKCKQLNCVHGSEEENLHLNSPVYSLVLVLHTHTHTRQILISLSLFVNFIGNL